MQYFIEHMGIFGGWLMSLTIQFARYVVIAGGAFCIFYVIYRQQFWHRKISPKMQRRQQLLNEIKYSVLSMMIFAGVAVCVTLAKRAGYTLMYDRISDYGWAYFFFTIVLWLFVHDTYFYWTHRFMHLPGIYKYVHRTHHLSHNPTPFAAFAFHPLETLIEAGIMLLVFVVPTHGLAVFIFVMISFIINVVGHLGFETYPRNFIRGAWIGHWQNTTTHHNMHHELIHCNYGLYFNFWDKLMGTNHAQYHQRFDEITHRENTQQLTGVR